MTPSLAALSPEAIDHLLTQLEMAEIPTLTPDRQRDLFAMLRRHLVEGLFCDPRHGGNREATGWLSIGYPGVHPDYNAAENLGIIISRPIRTLADGGAPLHTAGGPPPGFDHDAGRRDPVRNADIVLVGLGGVGALVAPRLAAAGLTVVALEAGPWHDPAGFQPDELAFAYYGRAGFGAKFLAETPIWRERDGGPARPLPFSLGRMCNGVGGSLLHYGARLRRMHPHHFQMRTTLAELGLLDRLDADRTVADWPIGYGDVEPYYEELEQAVGVAGNDVHPFIPRRTGLPMPPTRPFAAGERFGAAARSLGLHPDAIPVGQNTVPYRGRPAMRYSPWGEGLGSPTADRWSPTLDLLPAAIAGGRLDVRTGCRALAVLTAPDGRAAGVRYADPDGRIREQRAATVILAAYTFETVRLLFLSASPARRGGLGNSSGQLGRHFMTKQFPSVFGRYPDAIFNRHTGPGAQGVILEDFLTPDFLRETGLAGGGTLSTENQLLPIQIGHEPVPPGTSRWGPTWKAFVRDWNHRCAIRTQTDTLPYLVNRLDLDPCRRDGGPLALPTLRVTYEIRAHERRLIERMIAEATRLHREMGAAEMWPGPAFTGIGSAHDLGGCRMGADPATSVVGPDLAVHDTPGLYVMSGAVFPSCHAVNPTLTLWAICLRAADQLLARIGGTAEGSSPMRLDANG